MLLVTNSFWQGRERARLKIRQSLRTPAEYTKLSPRIFKTILRYGWQPVTPEVNWGLAPQIGPTREILIPWVAV